MPGLNVVWGGAAVVNESFNTQEKFDELSKVLKAGGCKTIDTATLYGASEELLHKFGASKDFVLDSKAVGGFQEGHAEREVVVKEGEQSHYYLGDLDIWYLHSPSYVIPLESTLAGINENYKKGYFKRFGLSNFKPEMVQQVYDICKKEGYPLPTVYQGNYNPVARLAEDELLPLLRKLGISFYAYSPIAGGFLTKSKEDIANGKGRFDTSTFIGQMYSGLYARPTLLEALEKWDATAKEEGVTRAELAYRWVNYNSALKPEHGDGIVFGASNVNQAKQTLESLQKGPLSEKAASSINTIWETIKHEAPLDNLHK